MQATGRVAGIVENRLVAVRDQDIAGREIDLAQDLPAMFEREIFLRR
jgi:hypothetical protein